MQDFLPWITGGGGALAVLAIGLWLFLTGKVHSDPEFRRLETEYADLRAAYAKITEALSLERQRADDATQAGGVTNQLIAGLVQLATEHRAAEKHEHAEHQEAADAAEARATAALDLTGKDLGLLCGGRGAGGGGATWLLRPRLSMWPPPNGKSKPPGSGWRRPASRSSSLCSRQP